MRYLNWVKVNKILWLSDNKDRAILKLKKEYKIVFPIFRKRSKSEVVELKSYDDIVNEYATSGKTARHTKLIFG